MSTPSSFTPVAGKPRGDFYYDDDDSHGQGLVTFAGVLITIAGVLNTVYGIAGISKAHVFVRNAHYVFGDLRLWGWFLLALGIAQFFAAAAVWRGTSWGRWFAVGCASINALLQTLWMPAYPLLAITVLTLDIIAIYGLLAYGGRRRYYKEQQARQAAAG